MKKEQCNRIKLYPTIWRKGRLTGFKSPLTSPETLKSSMTVKSEHKHSEVRFLFL